MLLDIRTIVAALLGCYAVVLILVGLAHDSVADRAPAGGWNINVWAGLGMLVVAVAFVVWARLRPAQAPDADTNKNDTDKKP